MVSEARVVPTSDGYDLWAEIYDDEANPLVIIEGPEVVRALGDVKGLRVLDVGCGNGLLLNQFRTRYQHLIGLEFSSQRLKQATINL